MPEFTLTSTAFAAGDMIPRRFTCDGEDVSPDLEWSGAPAGTVALALVVDDPDARGWVHWLVLDVPGAADGKLARDVGTGSGAPRPGPKRLRTSRLGWPVPAVRGHRYTFTLYALGAPLGLRGSPDGAEVRKALARAQVLDKAVLAAKYRRGG